MAKKAYHSLSYLRAQTAESHTQTLQEDLLNALAELPDVDMRKVEYSGKTLTGTVLEKRDGMALLQFAASVPGEQASTLPSQSAGLHRVTLGTLDAPDGHDFSNGDLICLVEGDDIFVCSSVIRDDMLYPFLVGLFSNMKKDVHAPDWALELFHGANTEAMSHIQKHGIKSIQLMATTDAQTLSQYSVKKEGNFLQRFFARDMSLYEKVKDSGAKVYLTISRSLFNKANFAWLEKEANIILNEGNANYIIVTSDNHIFKPNDMLIRQRKPFTPFG